MDAPSFEIVSREKNPNDGLEDAFSEAAPYRNRHRYLDRSANRIGLNSPNGLPSFNAAIQRLSTFSKGRLVRKNSK
jgi:hypothetical protein